MPSIEKRGKRSWRLIVEAPTAANGERDQEKKTIRVEDEALLKAPTKLQNYLNLELAKFQMEVESGEYIKPGRTTFEDFVPVWKNNFAASNLGDYTRMNYYSIIESQLIPEFGRMEINNMKTMHIVKFMTKLRKPEGRKDGRNKPLATNTLLNIYRVLKSILDNSKKWKYISSNPMDGVDRPVADKKEKKEMKLRKKSYTTAEAKLAILALYEEPEMWRFYFLGVILGGFRRGEMLAVEWAQVDFDQGGIFIDKQLSFDEDGNTVIAEVKTEESEAFVAMPTFYMNELKNYKSIWNAQKEDLGVRWQGEGKQYLFHNFGRALYPDSPTNKWRKLLQAHNLPRIRLHDLRHTTAMLLREDHVDMKSIQERLRHARLETTSNIYTHKSDLVSRHTADRLEKFNPQTYEKLGTNGEHFLQ